jgi:transposase
MAEAYPIELRTRVVDAYESGAGSFATVGQQFEVGEATVKRWVWQYRRDGCLVPRRKSGGNGSKVSLEEVESIVAALGDANAGEITAAYNRGKRGNARRHVSSIKRALHRAGYVVKKNESVRWSNSDPTSSPSVGLSSGRSAASQSGNSCSSTSLASTRR